MPLKFSSLEPLLVLETAWCPSRHVDSFFFLVPSFFPFFFLFPFFSSFFFLSLSLSFPFLFSFFFGTPLMTGGGGGAGCQSPQDMPLILWQARELLFDSHPQQFSHVSIVTGVGPFVITLQTKAVLGRKTCCGCKKVNTLPKARFVNRRLEKLGYI